MRSNKQVLNQIGGLPIDKKELVSLLNTKADKIDLISGLQKKVERGDILK